MTDNIEVTQADREVGARYYKKRHPNDYTFPEMALEGKCDAGLTIQAFARHRITSVAEVTAQRDELLAVAKYLLKELWDDWHSCMSCEQFNRFFATELAAIAKAEGCNQ